jgi:hypothetical protein
MFYHNNVIREHAVFVNPLTNVNEPIDIESGLTQDYDSTVFISTVKDYLTKFSSFLPDGKVSVEAVISLSKEILDFVGEDIISISNIRAGYKGRLTPGTSELIQKKLKETDNEDDE